MSTANAVVQNDHVAVRKGLGLPHSGSLLNRSTGNMAVTEDQVAARKGGKMGYLNFAGLSRFFGKIMERLNGKVNIQQGVENEECYLVVDESGDLALRDVPITLGIPAEWDWFGVISLNRENCAEDTYSVMFAEEGAAFEIDCTYAGSAHLYGASGEYVSDIDLAMYVETDAGTDRLVFYNHLLMPGGIFYFIWEVNITEDFVRVEFSTSDRVATIESLFTSGSLSRIDFIIRKVQKEPW